MLEEHNLAPFIAKLRAQQSDGWSESVYLQDLQIYVKQDDKHQQLKIIIWKGFPDHTYDKVARFLQPVILADTSQFNYQG